MTAHDILLPCARGLLLALAIGCCGPAVAGFYSEVGDAGDRFASQSVGAGPFGGIEGSIGDGDASDAFAFYFAGGSLFAKTTVYLGVEDYAFFLAGLWSAQPPDPIIPTDPYQPVDPMTPIYSESATGVVGFDLLAGNYIIELNVGLGFDPPFTIDLFTLNPDFEPFPPRASISAPRSVSLPTTLSLLGAGLLGLGALRRRG